jgi:capsular exopolysaccharide synthesis family protein
MPVRGGPGRPRPSAAPARAASIDPLRLLRRHILGLIVACIIGAGLGVGSFLALQRLYPLYSNEVLFEVRPGVREAGDVTTQVTLKDEDVSRIASTQLVLLKSRKVLEDAVTDPDVQQKTEWFQQNFTKDGAPLVAEAIDELEENLNTSVVRGTELFRVSWSAHRARDVPIVLNAVGRAFMAKRKSLDADIYSQNLDLFRAQQSDTNLQISDLDSQIKSYITDMDITSLDDPRFSEAALAVSEIVTNIAGATEMFSLARSTYLQVAAKLEGTMQPTQQDVLEAENDFALVPHIRAVEDLKIMLRVTREKFRDGHSAVQEAESRLRAAEAEKRAKTDEILERNLNAQLKMHQDLMERYQRMLEELEIEREEKSAKLSELAARQSQFQALQSQREHLMIERENDRALIKEIQLMRLRSDAQRVGIALMANEPRELSFPKPEIIIPLGILLALGLTVGVIFVREMTDHRIKSASDLTVLPGAHLLGVIPDLEDDPTKCQSAELVLRRFPSSVLAESYRQVCTPLARAIDRAGYQTLVLVGGLPYAGTTTAATNIAIGLAATGHDVLLVDANFRRPGLAKAMSLKEDAPGLGDLLAGETSLDATVADVEPGISVLPAGTPASRVIDRLNTERFDSLVAEMRSRYHVIIFDSPPAVVAGEPMVLANKLDASLLLVRAYQEQRGLVARLVNQLSDAHAEMLGIILNRPRGTAGGYFKKNFATMAEYASRTPS